MGQNKNHFKLHIGYYLCLYSRIIKILTIPIPAICALLISLFLYSCSSVQKSTEHIGQFKVVILPLDSAIIDTSLRENSELIRASFIRDIKDGITRAEIDLKRCDSLSGNDSMKLRFRKIAQAQLTSSQKAYEISKNWTYLDILLNGYMYVYKMSLYDIANVEVLDTSISGHRTMAEIANRLQADYVLSHSDVHTTSDSGKIKLHVRTQLYSKSANNIIYDKEFLGDNTKQSVLFGCSDDLSCIFGNALQASCGDIIQIFQSRELGK